MSAEGHWLPLFPLRLVLFPGETLPLHIFEARYRAMLEHCQATGDPFGVILDHPQMATVGCTALLAGSLQHPDGRSDILTKGGERFTCGEVRTHAGGYLEARASAYADVPMALPTSAGPLLIELLRRLRQEEGSEPGPDEEHDPIDAAKPGYTFRIAAHCPMALEDRQALLELRSESARDDALLRHFAQAIPKARQRKEDQYRVLTNGHLEHH
jgi:Lon protease-like protein